MSQVKSDRFRNPWIHFGLMAVIYGLGISTLFYHTIGHVLSAAKPVNSVPTIACPTVVAKQTIAISDKGFSPNHLTVKVCTEVTFVNQSNHAHIPAFGEHSDHDHSLPYTEKLLKPGQSNSVIINHIATYTFHDHLDDALTGNVRVVN